MSPDPDCGLLIFFRSLIPGKVKTRIASKLGDRAAFEIYKELTAFTIALASKVNLPVYLFYEGNFPDKIKNSSFHYLHQAEGDLGQKMQSAFEYVLDMHHKAIIIGSDCPELSVTDIEIACEKLNDYDFVIGPAEDGGYYLLGLKHADKVLFEHIPWGTSKVFEETTGRIRGAGKSFFLLRTLFDIDIPEDWERYKKKKYLKGTDRS